LSRLPDGDPLSPARRDGRTIAVAGKIPLIDLAGIETCIRIAKSMRIEPGLA